VEGSQPLKIVGEMRQPVPLHCGAFRKVLLAHQKPEWIEEYIGSLKPIKFTPRTITSKAVLQRELAAIRARGYAVSYGEYLRDSGGVAAPVFGEREELEAALFIWGPYARLNENTTDRYARIVVDAASTLTRLFRGQRPNSRDEKTTYSTREKSQRRH
jgi:DNA-binding IclR family transcriptional regulator